MSAVVKNELITKLNTLLASHTVRYPQWNTNYTGSPSLPNQEFVNSVASTNFNQASLTVTATMSVDTTKSDIIGGYLLYTTSDLTTEEWFQGDDNLSIVNGVITADVPAGASAVVLNLIDENNFLILTDEISTISTAEILINTTEANQTFQPENEDVYSELVGNATSNNAYLQMKTEGGGDGANFNIVADNSVVCDSITFSVRSLVGDTANFSVSLAGITQNFQYTSLSSTDQISHTFNTAVSLTEVTQSMQFLLTNLTNSGSGVTPRCRIYDIKFHIDLNTVGAGLIPSITLDADIDEQIFQPENEEVYSELIGSTTVGGSYIQTRTEGGGDGFKMNIASMASVVCEKIRFKVRSLAGDTANFGVTVGNVTQSFEYVSTNSTNNQYYEFNTPITFTESAKSVEFLVTDLVNSSSSIPRFRVYDVTFYLDTASLINTTTGILTLADEEVDSQELKLSPNPVKGVFYLTKEVQSGELFNINGKKVYEFTGGDGGVDISNLSPGVYVLRAVYSGNKEEYLKLIKQ